jgi:hypothetical protein
LREAVTCREGGKESDREESIDGFHRDRAFLLLLFKEARPEMRDPYQGERYRRDARRLLCEVGAYAVAFCGVNL